jgi:HEAT repeat protein
MGARANSACPALVQALEEPRMAPAVATALAAIGCTDALEPLVRCTQKGRDAELRHAAARALAVLGTQRSIDVLTQLLAAAETPDLRQTAAESLVALGKGELGVPLLVECLTRPGADHDTAERALEHWLELEGNTERLEAWRALAGDPASTPTVAQAAERHKARAALLSKVR